MVGITVLAEKVGVINIGAVDVGAVDVGAVDVGAVDVGVGAAGVGATGIKKVVCLLYFGCVATVLIAGIVGDGVEAVI